MSFSKQSRAKTPSHSSAIAQKINPIRVILNAQQKMASYKIDKNAFFDIITLHNAAPLIKPCILKGPNDLDLIALAQQQSFR
jgi:hypothetical protein